MKRNRSTVKPISIACGLALTMMLSACEDGNMPEFLKQKDKPQKTADAQPGATKPGKTVEKDVEAPEVFQKTGKALWDGRPSLGGVWVAHPDNKEPERVIIRNKANGKFVIGALFRRERDNPGPPFQLSSDAASALGAIAGSPVEISVTAMRTKTVAVSDQAEDAPKASPDPDVKPVDEPETINSKPLDTPSPAVKPAPAPSSPTAPVVKPLPRPEGVKPVAAPRPAPKKPTFSANARYVQMGFFSVESNAKGTLRSLQAKGISGKIVQGEAKGKKFWRVLAGPAETSAQQKNLLNKVKGMGFTDAYLVKG